MPLPNARPTCPTVSDDGLVYTIPLRAGVMFHHGRAVTAADYKYAFERALDPKNESWAASYIYTIDGAQEIYDGQAKERAASAVVDDMTLEVTLTQPDVTFLYALTQPFTAPVPDEEVERLGDNWGRDATGNGPYRSSTTTRSPSARTSRSTRRTSGPACPTSTRSSSSGAWTPPSSC